LTEIAGHEIARHEITRQENAGHEYDGPEMTAGRKIAGEKVQRYHYNKVCKFLNPPHCNTLCIRDYLFL